MKVKTSKRTGGAAGLIALALLAAGCGSELPGENRTGQPVKLYFTGGEQFQPVTRDLKVGESTLEPAARMLVEGPNAGERSGGTPAQTQIPEGTELEGVKVSFGEAAVKLSGEFLEGVPADPAERSLDQEAELDARLSQLTYTLTQFDQVESVKVLAGGEVVAPNVEREDYARPDDKPVQSEPDEEEEADDDEEPVARQLAGLSGKAARIGRVQERLWLLGYLPKVAIDGQDGYRTQQAVMAFQAWEGLERDGVAGKGTKAALRSASRPAPKPTGSGKRIEVYRDKGVALLVKGAQTKRAVHVSTGAGGATPAGSFEVFRKELNSWSVPFSTWLPYASYFNNGIAFHEYPEVPPYPASHGCVRVSAPEAPFLYDFAPIGTAVRVF